MNSVLAVISCQYGNSQCDSCEWLKLCHGDCQKMRGADAKPDTLSTLCEGWQMFYEHTMARFKELAEVIKKDMGN